MSDNGLLEFPSPLRHLKAIDFDTKSDLQPSYENSWAIIIGINNYVHLNKLESAVKDALGIAEVLSTRLNFPRENIFLSLDPKPDPDETPYILPGNVRLSTKAEIEDLFLNLLPERAGVNDRVLVFYAGHGEQRPVPGEKEESGAFLIPADAQPGKWNSYIDWETMRRAGDDFCRAKHIFYILDACYSGIVNTRDAGEPPREMRDALTSRARQALAAGTSRQVVADRGRGGHSPFTWHLIQGLRGDAADPERSIGGANISAHDLIGYVRHKVSEENSTEQTPSGGSIVGHGGGDFIFTSPLIGFSGQEHFRLGAGLVELGLRSGETVCFESAVRNLRYALLLKQMARDNDAEVNEWLGRAYLHVGSDKALDESLSPLKSAADKGRATARLYLGIAQARQGNMEEASQFLESFAASLPDHPDAGWAAAFAHQLRETGGRRKLALLVGINEYSAGSFSLQGCINDVVLVKALLEDVYGFDPANITTLVDEQATASNIIAGLEHLAANTRPQDTVVLLFSGHGSQISAKDDNNQGDGRWYVLVPHDIEMLSESWKNTITEPQIHTLLTQIPARDKLFIAGAAHVCPDHDTSIDEGGYRFFSACQRNEYDMETTFDGKIYGVFIYYLCKIARELAGKKSSDRAGRIASGVKRAIDKGEFKGQNPQYFGKSDESLLPMLTNAFLSIHEFGDRREYAAFDAGALQVWQSRLDTLGSVPHPQAWLSLARGWVLQEQPLPAIRCVKQALLQPGCDGIEARSLLCKAHLQARKPNDAIKNARAMLEHLPPAAKSDVPINDLIQLSSPHRRALIVAIQNYPEPIDIRLGGTAKDAEALKKVLIEHRGFSPENIELLIDREATHDAILKRFDDLILHAETEPALFYFAGLGIDLESGPAIVAADVSNNGGPSTILLKELGHRIEASPTNLVTIIDAGWTKFDKATIAEMASMRIFLPHAERENISRHFGGRDTVDRDPSQIPQIGLVTIYTASITKIYEREPAPIKAIKREGQKERLDDTGTRGVLTMALVDALQNENHTKTYAELVEAVASAKPHALMQQPDIHIFENVVVWGRAWGFLARLSDRTMIETVELLYRLTELRKSSDPCSYLDLAIICLMFNDHAHALDAVETGLMYCQKKMVEAHPDPNRNTPGDVSWPEAHYIHGLILYNLKQYSAAESALGIALRQFRGKPDPKSEQGKVMHRVQMARAHYWHACAIQELIRQNLLKTAGEDYAEYQKLGAPLGVFANMKEFLAEKAKTKQDEG